MEEVREASIVEAKSIVFGVKITLPYNPSTLIVECDCLQGGEDAPK